jgi:adenosylcobinamide-phosphate synthase
MAVAIAAGFAADRLAGDPARGHPVAGFGRLAAAFEAVLWRPSRAAGCAHVAGLVGAVAGAVAALDRLARRTPVLRAAVGAAVLWAALGGRSLERAALAVAGAVAAGDVDRARALLPALVGRDPAALDADGLVRAAVESVAENTSDAVVAPLLWMALLGPAGAAGHRVLNTLDAMVGHRSPRHERFGWAAARLDDAANWPAARLTVGLTACAAPSSRRAAAWRAARDDGHAHPSPNAGRVEAAFAGALGVRLGGRTVYAHGTEERPVLGEGRAPVCADVRAAVRLATAVDRLALGAALGLAAARRRAR